MSHDHPGSRYTPGCPRCLEIARGAARRYRKNHREKTRAAVRAYGAVRYAERREWMDAFKVGQGCIDCGFDRHPAALDLDHVRGEKHDKVSNMLTLSWDRLQDEVAKCEVVCANCHRIRTVERRAEAMLDAGI